VRGFGCASIALRFKVQDLALRPTKRLAQRYNPKKPLRPLLPLHFKVLILVLVAAPSRCISRF